MIITYTTNINNCFLGVNIFMVFERVAEILAEQLSLDADKISMESLLEEDLDADSLDVIDLVMSIEDEFQLEVPDEIIENMKSVGDIVNFIENNQ